MGGRGCGRARLLPSLKDWLGRWLARRLASQFSHSSPPREGIFRGAIHAGVAGATEHENGHHEE